MIGLGTIINTAAIIFGGIIGHFNRKRISLQRHCRAFMKDMTGSFTAWFRETENRK